MEEDATGLRWGYRSADAPNGLTHHRWHLSGGRGHSTCSLPAPSVCHAGTCGSPACLLPCRVLLTGCGTETRDRAWASAKAEARGAGACSVSTRHSSHVQTTALVREQQEDMRGHNTLLTTPPRTLSFTDIPAHSQATHLFRSGS